MATTRRQFVSNIACIASLAASVVGLLGLIGALIAGAAGAVGGALVGAAVLVIGPSLAPVLVRWLYRARRVRLAEAPELHEMMETLAERAGLRRAPRLYQVPSEAVTIFTLSGAGRPNTIVSDGLLNAVSGDELAALLAHEVAHVRAGDVRVFTFADIFSRLAAVLALAGAVLLVGGIIASAGMAEVAVPWAAAVVMIFAPALAGAVQLALPKSREYRADHQAVALTGDAASLAHAVRKLELADFPGPSQVLFGGYRSKEPSLLRRHPPAPSRVKRARVTEAAPGRAPQQPTLVRPRAAGPAHSPHWHMTGLWF